jgi:hypothetical protein
MALLTDSNALIRKKIMAAVYEVLWLNTAGVVEQLSQRDARLEQCDLVRLIDFLVSRAGNEKLLSE